jgi:hypothetical protein
VLLEEGAELDWIGHDGKTPLDAAYDAGDESMIAWLRDLGAKRADALRSKRKE